MQERDNTLFTINIRDYLSTTAGEDELKTILSGYSCPKNPDVQHFIREQAINFTRKSQSVTYLVFMAKTGILAGYFTLAIKPITVKAEAFISNTVKKKISRVSEFDEENMTYSLAAYLIAQLGKNYTDGIDKMITGRQLLDAAMERVKESQYSNGGMVVFLEAEDHEKLLRFYDENRFMCFDTRHTKGENSHELIQLLKLL